MGREATWDALLDHVVEQPSFQAELAEHAAELDAEPRTDAEMGLHSPGDPRVPGVMGQPVRVNPDEVTPLKVDRSVPPKRPIPPTHPASGRPTVWVVGAHPDCDWVVGGDPYISGMHCLVTKHVNGLWTVEDLGSTNGTWLIRQAPHGPAKLRVSRPTTIMTGDVVEIGKTQLGGPPSPPVNGR